jgi:rubrerythrin
METEQLKKANFIEAYELIDGKYRHHQCIGTFKIGEKEKWFEINEDGNAILTNLAWLEIESKGLKYNNKKWLTFDLLTSEEVRKKIQNEKSMINFYSKRLNKLEELVN